MTALFKPKIEAKLTLSYLPLVFIMFIIAAFALISLKQANDTSKHIVEYDMVVVEAANQLLDDLLAQESYGRRYLILGSNKIQSLFWERSAHFEALVAELRGLPGGALLPLSQLTRDHQAFNALYQNRFSIKGNSAQNTAGQFDTKAGQLLENMVVLLEKMDDQIKGHQRRKMLAARQAGIRAFLVTALLSGLGILVGVISASMMTRSISRAIIQLKQSAMEISQGNFDRVPQITSKDELGDLAAAFTLMAQRLARLEEMYLDASPLTHLPGGRAIENLLYKKIHAGETLAFCLLDLDNFKAFNDYYGYSRGNEVIKRTAAIIDATVAEYSDGKDFVGHIGGDDFAVITTLNRYTPICGAIIRRFDSQITTLYDPADVQVGHITAKSRQGDAVRFPIMTISIAVVTNENLPDLNPIQVGEIAAELKAHAKSLVGSVFVENRRSLVQ